MARVVRREAAKRDLIRHFVYLAENATLKIARSFKDAAHDTFVALSEAPEMGAPHKIR
jgi:toxin ParE1/3/4